MLKKHTKPSGNCPRAINIKIYPNQIASHHRCERMLWVAKKEVTCRRKKINVTLNYSVTHSVLEDNGATSMKCSEKECDSRIL